MAAFTRNRNPCLARADQTCNTKPCAGAQNHTLSVRMSGCTADIFQMVIVEGDNSQCLCFKIIEDGDVLQVEALHHLARLHNPLAIGERNFIALDRAGNGNHCRARLDGCVIQNNSLDCIFQRCEIFGQQNRKFFWLGVGINQNSKAGIGAADITDKDRKNKVRIDIRHC